MALTEVLGETGAAEADALEREVLESETVSSSGSPDELLGAMTRTLAPGTMAVAETAGGDTGETSPDVTQIEVHNSGQADDRSGEIIHDRYQLVRQLGKGGMGTVYIARHTTLPKTFAVKVLNARYAKRKDIAERFLQEARAVSLISHENVVGVIDFGREDDGSAFLVMEHLRGESLSAVCRRDAPMARPRVSHIMAQLCRALQAAHAAGIVHRDIKPENVLRVGRHDDPDFIKVLDFGLAKMQVSGGLRLTQTGMVLGTPDYMSPEQARGRTADHRADIYAAGVMMYELLCGRVPFQAKTFAAMRQKHLLEPPEPPSKWAPDAGITDEMDAICLRAMAKDPSHRFESMDDMRAAIEAVGTGKAPVELVERATLPLLSERSVLDDKSPRPQASVPPTVMLGADETVVQDGHKAAQAGTSGSSSRRGVGLLIAALVLAGFGLAYSQGAFDAMLERGGSEDVAQPTQPAQPAQPTEVALEFETNVPVVVLDIDGQPRFGDQPTHELTIPRSNEAMRLVLHADGYRELHVVVTPDRDQILEAKLERLPPPEEPPPDEPLPEEPPPEESEPVPVTDAPKPKPKPEPEPEPEGSTTDHSFSPEIVDPFDQ